MMLATNEVVKTLSGRLTTPFPKIDLSSDRKSLNTMKRVEYWLHENAALEAEVRKDEFNLTQFKGEKPGKLPQASKDAMHLYLFGTI